MRRSSNVFAVAAAVAFVAAVAYVRMKPAPTPPARPPTVIAAPTAAKPTAAAPAAPSPATARTTTTATDVPSYRFAELERLAAAGDVDAAAELGGLLGVCWRHSRGSAKQIEESVIAGMADGVEPPPIGGTPAPPELVILLLLQAQPELEQRCAGLDKQELWKDRARAPALLERAADAGRVQAMLDYARYAFVGYDGTRHMLKEADEIARRKQKARAYLRQALNRGDARALFLLGDAYASGPLENVDPLQAYAYLSAFFRSPAAQDWPPRLGELYLQTLARHLDAAQLAQAQAQGLQLHRDVEAGAPAP